jgi:hypothetical protein
LWQKELRGNNALYEINEFYAFYAINEINAINALHFRGVVVGIAQFFDMGGQG